MATPEQSSTGSAEEARQGAETHSQRDWSWVEAAVWTERMLSALGNGVNGGKWYSLIDHQRWPNAYFANAGLFALHTAWQSARQSR